MIPPFPSEPCDPPTSFTPEQIARASPMGMAAHCTRDTAQPITIPPHLALINQLLVEMAGGRLKRLIVSVPPRHGKSILISKWFPAWYLCNFPNNRVMLCAYEATFAADWGRQAREVIQEFGAGKGLFNIRVRDDKMAASDWLIDGYMGGMKTAGVGGPILGRGANIAIIDDPVKNAEDAESPTQQMKNWDWYQSTLLSRLEPGGSVAVLAQRFSRDDLIGKILAHQAHLELEGDMDPDERWVYVELPAEALEGDILGRAPGEPLWPARYPAKELRKMKRSRTNYWWQANYQQNPLAARGAGEKFNRDWFTIIPHWPTDLVRVVLTIDLASSEVKAGIDPDYTSCALSGRRRNGRYVMQVFRCRKSPEKTEEFIKEVAATVTREFGSVEIIMQMDPAAAGKTVISHFSRNVLPRYKFWGIPVRQSKERRIDLLSSAAEPVMGAPRGIDGKQKGDIELVNGPWLTEFWNQAEQYPVAKHDDDLDSMATGIEVLGRFGISTKSGVPQASEYGVAIPMEPGAGSYTTGRVITTPNINGGAGLNILPMRKSF